jgi:hypothetical protein
VPQQMATWSRRVHERSSIGLCLTVASRDQRRSRAKLNRVAPRGRPARGKPLARYRGHMDGVRMTRASLNPRYYVRSIPPGFRVRAGFDSSRGDCGDRSGMGQAAAGGARCLFLSAHTARQLVGISVGIGSNRRRKLFQIPLVMVLSDCRPGPPKVADRALFDVLSAGLAFGRAPKLVLRPDPQTRLSRLPATPPCWMVFEIISFGSVSPPLQVK